MNFVYYYHLYSVAQCYVLMQSSQNNWVHKVI